jgi:hypothetical protein
LVGHSLLSSLNAFKRWGITVEPEMGDAEGYEGNGCMGFHATSLAGASLAEASSSSQDDVAIDDD